MRLVTRTFTRILPVEVESSTSSPSAMPKLAAVCELSHALRAGIFRERRNFVSVGGVGARLHALSARNKTRHMVVRRNRRIGVLRSASQTGLLERIACERNLARFGANGRRVARKHRGARNGAARGVVQAAERNAIGLAEGIVDIIELKGEIVALAARLRQIGENLVDGASLARRSHGLVALFGNRPLGSNGATTLSTSR